MQAFQGSWRAVRLRGVLEGCLAVNDALSEPGTRSIAVSPFGTITNENPVSGRPYERENNLEKTGDIELLK